MQSQHRFIGNSDKIHSVISTLFQRQESNEDAIFISIFFNEIKVIFDVLVENLHGSNIGNRLYITKLTRILHVKFTLPVDVKQVDLVV